MEICIHLYLCGVKKRILVFSIVVMCFSICMQAQYNQQKLYADLEGDELLEKVVDNFKADILFFTYGMSRDTMFRYVYGVNDSLSCVYSGHTLYMDPNRDPTTTVYLNGSDDGINTEHTYPQSKGAGFGNARSDMHHLYPSRSLVNQERSNFPFGDIPDDQATKWFYKDQTLITKPSGDIDKFSEWKWQVFEPRESAKGNIARAVMYFYTMYKSQADSEDPNFFWDMLPSLCDWHFLDPVDSAEYARTNLIAKWQVYPNPFVLDCSLAARSYCSTINDACVLAVPVEELELDKFGFDAYFTIQQSGIVFKSEEKGIVQIFDINGRKLQSIHFNGGEDFFLTTRHFKSGNYVIQFIASGRSSSKIIFVGD